jgi:hypothetical protein
MGQLVFGKWTVRKGARSDLESGTDESDIEYRREVASHLGVSTLGASGSTLPSGKKPRINRVIILERKRLRHYILPASGKWKAN